MSEQMHLKTALHSKWTLEITNFLPTGDRFPASSM